MNGDFIEEFFVANLLLDLKAQKVACTNPVKSQQISIPSAGHQSTALGPPASCHPPSH